jgi:hypothetical protein
MKPKTTDISLLKALVHIYRKWSSQVFVYFTSIVLATCAALVLDLRFHWSSGRVLLYVLPLTGLLMILVPILSVVVIAAVRDREVYDLKPQEQILTLRMVQEKEGKMARLLGAIPLIGLLVFSYLVLPVKTPSAPSLSQSDLIITKIKSAPIEYQLAYLDNGQLPRGTDVNAARIRYLLKSLSEKTGDSNQHIADRTSAATDTLKRDFGREVTRQRFLEEANGYYYDASKPQINYDSLAALLITTMGK